MTRRWGIYGSGAIGRGWCRDHGGKVILWETEEAARAQATTAHLAYQHDMQPLVAFAARQWFFDPADQAEKVA